MYVCMYVCILVFQMHLYILYKDYFSKTIQFKSPYKAATEYTFPMLCLCLNDV